MKSKFKFLSTPGFAVWTGIALAALSCAIGLAQTLPTYSTQQATGSTSAGIIFHHGPTSQVRIVDDIWTSDLATAQLLFYTGTTSHYTTVTNVGASTSLTVDSTNGIIANSLLLIEGTTGNTTSNVVVTVSTVNNQTNITCTGNVNAAVGLNNEVEVLSTPVALAVGAKTNGIVSSDGLFVGNYGRGVYVTLSGTSACTNAVTVHYDATSN